MGLEFDADGAAIGKAALNDMTGSSNWLMQSLMYLWKKYMHTYINTHNTHLDTLHLYIEIFYHYFKILIWMEDLSCNFFFLEVQDPIT